MVSKRYLCLCYVRPIYWVGKLMRAFLFVFLITFLPGIAMSDDVTAQAQRLLNELGYDAGPVDGVMGNKSHN